MNGKLTTKENRDYGGIDLNVYLQYFKFGNIIFFVINIFMFFMAVVARIISDWWVSNWVIDNFNNLSNTQYGLIYLGLALVSLLLSFGKDSMWVYFNKKVGKELFHNFLIILFRKKMSFFDTTPTGQLLNLSTKDIDIVDSLLPFTFHIVLSNWMAIFSSLILISISSVIAIPVILICIIFNLFIFYKYIRITREYRRLQNECSSPIVSRIIELCQGLVIFRTLDKIEYQKKKFVKDVNNMIKSILHERALSNYLFFYSQILFGMIITCYIFLVVIGKNMKWSFVVNNSNVIGVSLTWLLTIPLSIIRLLHFSGETTKNMISVQRLFNNVDKTNLEDKSNNTIVKNWPKSGDISLSNISAKYREGLPLVLNDITIQIYSGEKIGVVGRTGSGKSSLLLLLTRLIDPINDEKGEMKVDGVNVLDLTINQYRKAFKVIPQDPFLLSGTFRNNIDPFNQYTDEEVIMALEKAFMMQEKFIPIEICKKIKINSTVTIETEQNNLLTDWKYKVLEYEVGENGRNLSMGERQLVCIARIMLTTPMILFMDEATSNMDYYTDSKIQEILNKEFSKTTIISIAHRLNTIIGFDRILVLNKGQIVEFDKPSVLLAKNSELRNMVLENGEAFLKNMISLCK